MTTATVTTKTWPIPDRRNDAAPATHLATSAPAVSCPEDNCHFCSGPETD
ncbi:hypothetical protein [Arthrobacter sedimenti]|nr:hypothetical protein [Arthrobacter sedimenti]